MLLTVGVALSLLFLLQCFKSFSKIIKVYVIVITSVGSVSAKRSITGHWRKIWKIQNISSGSRRSILSHWRLVWRKVGRRAGGIIQIVKIGFKLLSVVDVGRMLLWNIWRDVVTEWGRSGDSWRRNRGSSDVGILKGLSRGIGDIGRGGET